MDKTMAEAVQCIRIRSKGKENQVVEVTVELW